MRKIIDVALSVKAYEKKLPKNDDEWGKVELYNTRLTIEDFIKKLSEGHYISQPTDIYKKDTFLLTERKEENIKAFSYIPIDLDNTIDLSLEEIQDRIKDLNCIFYPSFSYNKNENINKYRILFILDRTYYKTDTMTLEEFKNKYKQYYDVAVNLIMERIADSISQKAYEEYEKQVKKGKVTDISQIVCDKNMDKPFQGMWGTDKLVLKIEGDINISIDKIIFNINSSFNHNNNSFNNNINVEGGPETMCDYINTPSPHIYKNSSSGPLINKDEKYYKEWIYYHNNTYKDYLNTFKDKYEVITDNFGNHQFNPFPSDKYWIDFGDWIEIVDGYHIMENGKRKYVVLRYKDGQGRRKVLYVVAVLLRLIKKDIELEEMLYNLVKYFIRHIDNFEDKIKPHELFEICVRVLEKDWAELMESYMTMQLEKKKTLNRPSKKKNLKYIKPIKSKRELQRDMWFEKIKREYDPSISQRKNADKIGCARHYIKDYFKDIEENGETYDTIDDIFKNQNKIK